jgi:PhzF family phenazine biosynthesis protein
MRIPVFQVDAFTNRPFTGNPAAVCPLTGWLDDQMLQKVAAENNLSATAFLVPRDDLYELRWFTPTCEVRLCGHATLASGYVVLDLLKPGLKTARFETRFGGTLAVCKNGELFLMDFPASLPETCPHPPEGLLRALGRHPMPSQVLEVNDTYIAVYTDQSAIQDFRPNFEQMKQLHPFAVAVTAPGDGDGVDFVSRYFAPSYGVPEDPVTGSVHCALTPFWTAQLGKGLLHARQLSERGGDLWCEMAGARVRLQGSAVLTMQGSLEI